MEKGLLFASGKGSNSKASQCINNHGKNTNCRKSQHELVSPSINFAREAGLALKALTTRLSHVGKAAGYLRGSGSIVCKHPTRISNWNSLKFSNASINYLTHCLSTSQSPPPKFKCECSTYLVSAILCSISRNNANQCIKSIPLWRRILCRSTSSRGKVEKRQNGHFRIMQDEPFCNHFEFHI
jgi:hypothetical protein